MKHLFHTLSTALLLLASETLFAQQSATLRLDAQTTHQRITGFGGFVCSPQFQYNHMSTADIRKVWGTGSTVGCNIMRLYIPIGKGAWGQSLATAKAAKQMGLIVFASPWGQPAEWKTNGTSNAKNSDGTTGSLKRANWADYAQYLEDYVQYLRQNGVELDAISIQNEPDWPAEYAGCLWSASEMAEFVKTYGRSISCKIMAPETLAVSDAYVNALNKTGVLDCFDIYGGHQYGGIQSAYKSLAAKGKEIWMTEYLINWNESSGTTRQFDYSKDFFDFFRAINTCMLGDFNAWVHYAAKRYYGMLGDGTCGTSTGVVTKRGYVMAHFARFVTGMTRIDAAFAGAALEGSAYLSQTGDTVVAVIANPTDNEVNTVLDLPFYTEKGAVYTTTKTRNLTASTPVLTEETCRPNVSIAAQSVATVLFVRSRDRQPSDMKGVITRYDRLDDQTATKNTFGTTYKLSGKTKKLDHSTPLISARTNANFGYVALNDRYSTLVLNVKKVSSTLNYSSSNTTLTYVNAQGEVSTYNYGDLDVSRRENFNIVFDLSPATLTDGCLGLISLTNNNWSSTLTFNFGDVYLGTDYSATLTGAYVADDSNVLDYTSDAACVSLDLTAVTNLPDALPWLDGKNRIAYVSEGSTLGGPNVVVGTICSELSLTEQGGDFRPVRSFTTDAAILTLKIEGYRLIMLPFQAAVPEGTKAYTLTSEWVAEPVEVIPAHQPVLVEAQGSVTFCGSGDITYAVSPLDASLRGTYTQKPLYAGDYILAQHGGQWGLERLDAPATLTPFGVYAQPDTTEDFLPLVFESTGISSIATTSKTSAPVYDLSGRRLTSPDRLAPGIYIVDGKKVLVK
ncbi:MAG: hypothetical protein IJ693_01445 [Bacteroidaceae bacterium]|nr:hypothetical protein [Bacteroidaceae bacterium]